MSAAAGQGWFRRRFAALFAAGFLGVLALAPTHPETLRVLPLPPEMAGHVVLTLVSLAQG